MRKPRSPVAHLDLHANDIGAKGTGKILLRPDLGTNGALEGAGKLAEVMGQCASLADLDLHLNFIGDKEAGRLAGMLKKCASLAYLDLAITNIEDDRAGRLAEVMGQSANLAHLDLYSSGK